MAQSVREAYNLLYCVDPSGMRSSTPFKDMKTAFKAYMKKSERTEQDNPVNAQELDEARKELILLCKKYLDYKNKQNKGSHKRSEIEFHRVSVVEALYDRLKKDDFAKGVPEPADLQADKLIYEAKKNLFQGKNTVASVSVLLSAKKLKDEGIPLSIDGLKQKGTEYVKDAEFKKTVGKLKPGAIEDMVNTGAFEKTLENNKKHTVYMNAREGLFTSWENTREAKRVKYKAKRDLLKQQQNNTVKVQKK